METNFAEGRRRRGRGRTEGRRGFEGKRKKRRTTEEWARCEKRGRGKTKTFERSEIKGRNQPQS